MKCSVSGKVTDFQGNSLKYADVMILDKSFNPVCETKTDEFGKYKIEVESGQYMALVGLYEYGTRYLENWNWNICIRENIEIDMRIGGLEIYSINAFVPQGSNPPKIFIFFRPCSLKKYLENKHQIEASAVDYTVFGCNLENCGLTVSVNDEIVKVIKYDKILEYSAPHKIIAYLLQVEKPSNFSTEKISVIKIVLHDRETDEYGEGTLYIKFFS